MMAIFFSTTKGISSRDALLTGNKGVLNMPGKIDASRQA